MMARPPRQCPHSRPITLRVRVRSLVPHPRPSGFFGELHRLTEIATIKVYAAHNIGRRHF